MVFKKDLTPLSKGGSITKHRGKGSAMAGMPNRKQINQLGSAPGASINDYSKATPMANPSPPMGDWDSDGM